MLCVQTEKALTTIKYLRVTSRDWMSVMSPTRKTEHAPTKLRVSQRISKLGFWLVMGSSLWLIVVGNTFQHWPLWIARHIGEVWFVSLVAGVLLILCRPVVVVVGFIKKVVVRPHIDH